MVNVSSLPDDDYRERKICDLSIVPSLRCNLSCPFCMYGSSPSNSIEINFPSLRQFLGTVDWKRVPSLGFYGGEPSIEQALYQQVFNALPIETQDHQRFIITNGVWSKTQKETTDFIAFCEFNKLIVFVSGTPYHMKFQNRKRLEELAKLGKIHLKADDIIYPMGRARKHDWDCSRKCIWHRRPSRIAIFPSGHIIFQNCDGVDPVIGHVSYSSFDSCVEKVIEIRRWLCRRDKHNLNSLLFSLEKQSNPQSFLRLT